METLKCTSEPPECQLAIFDNKFEKDIPNLLVRFIEKKIPTLAITSSLSAEDYLRLSNLDLVDFQINDLRDTVSNIIVSYQRLLSNAQTTILVVDDSSGMRKSISRRLKLQHFNVLEAESAEESLEMLKSHSPTMIIRDYNMPGMNGVEMIQKIRQYHPKEFLPIVGLSANKAPHLAAAFIRSGANDFLPKPPRIDELLASFKLIHCD